MEWLTMAEAATRVAVSLRTVERYVEGGKLEAHSLPSGRLRVRRKDVDALLTPVHRPARTDVGTGTK